MLLFKKIYINIKYLCFDLKDNKLIKNKYKFINNVSNIKTIKNFYIKYISFNIRAFYKVFN